MTKNDCDFDTWFGNLNVYLLDEVGIDYKDEDSVKDDYENGKDFHDVADEIANEYR